MQVGLRHINAGTVAWLKDAVREANRSRYSLALELCEREGWRNARGELVLSAGFRAVLRIAERLGLDLPAARAPAGLRRECRVPAADFPDMSVTGPLESLGAVRIEPVSGDTDWRRWEAMMACHHPQGWARPPGGQLRYWIHAGAHGRLGGLCFAAAGWHQGARDRAIGWSADARAENLPKLIRNHRFLLLPGVRVHGLASAALRLAAGCVAEHWRERYRVRPVMAYTYIGPGHDGYCYRAAGWRRCAGRTAGQPPGRTAAGQRRRVWLLPLDGKWRETLCREPERPLAPPVALHADERADWAQREYSRSTHPDGRVRNRIVAMGRKWQHSPGAGLSAVFPDRAGKKAAYRLLSNEKVTMEHILEPHRAALVERCRQEAVVLAIQDTTTLNYDTLRATGGPGSPDGGGGGVSGLVAHVGLAMSAAGRALGVFELNADFRGKEDTGSTRWLRGFDRSGELADACPDARVVSVCDREGDFRELPPRAADDPRQTFLVRTSRSARLSVLSDTGGRTDLWEHMVTLPVLAGRTVEIAARGGGSARRKRTAELDIRAARVTLAAPADAADRRPVETLAVSVTEPDPPAGKEPLDWMLTVSRGEPDPETVREVVGWYEARWSIGEWFRVLKSGTRIGDRQPGTDDDLRKCLAFDAITACRVLHLQRLARDRPDAYQFITPVS